MFNSMNNLKLSTFHTKIFSFGFSGIIHFQKYKNMIYAKVAEALVHRSIGTSKP